MNEPANQALDYLKRHGLPHCDIVLILGSGLGGFEHHLNNPTIIPYADIPGFPSVTVAGHSGKLGFGTIADKTLIVFSGRFHYYEGHGLSTTTLPVRLGRLAGASTLIVTNAAGGINFKYQVGDFMNIVDTLNPGVALFEVPSIIRSYKNPLNLSSKVRDAADLVKMNIHDGTYLYVTGPPYETPAEIKMFRSIGADAVGMSTVPELLAAARLGMSCAGISLITNAASGVTDTVLDHSDIKEVAEKRTADFTTLMMKLIELL